MTVMLIDEDWSKVDPAALRAAGYSGLIGYISEDTTGKNLTPEQVRAAHAAGLDVGLVYEFATQAALGGAARGTRDAGIAVARARLVGAPAGVCLYAAVDWQVSAAQLPAVLAYALAFQAVCRAAGYRAGIYGSYLVCQHLAGHGWTGLLWQTYAWSSRLWCSAAVLRQTVNGIYIAGAVVDRDEAQALDWGQWGAHDNLTTYGVTDMNLSDPIPGTSTPNHPGDRNVADVLGDEGRLRAVLYGEAPPPAGTPLAKLLALAETPPAGGAPTQDQVDAAVLKALQDPTVTGAIGAAVASHIHVS